MKFMNLQYKNFVGRIFYFFFPLVAFVYIALTTNWRELAHNVELMSAGAILLIIVLYFVTVFLKYYRVYLILGLKQLNFSDFAKIAEYNILLNFLPLKLGEVYLIKFIQSKNFNTKAAIGNLIVLRIIDLIAIFIIFLVVFLLNFNFLIDEIQKFSSLKHLSINSAMVLSLIFVLFIFILKKISKLHTNINKFYTLLRQNLFHKTLFLSSVTIWGIMYLFGLIIMRDLNVILPTSKIFLGQSINLVVGVLPINTFANLGIFELTWGESFSMLGLSNTQAYSTGIIAHWVMILAVIVSGVITYFLKFCIYRSGGRTTCNET